MNLNLSFKDSYKDTRLCQWLLMKSRPVGCLPRALNVTHWHPESAIFTGHITVVRWYQKSYRRINNDSAYLNNSPSYGATVENVCLQPSKMSKFFNLKSHHMIHLLELSAVYDDDLGASGYPPTAGVISEQVATQLIRYILIESSL